MPALRDYYDVLGVARTASAKEIQGAFRKLARKFHPDVNQGDDDRFKEISEAHSVLSDPEKRKLYDQFGHGWQAAQAARAGGAPGAGRAGAGGPAGAYRTVSPQEFSELFGDGEAFGDVLGSIFGSRRGGRRRARPAEAEGTLEVSLREALTGTARTLSTEDGRRVEVKVPAGVTTGTVLRVPGIRVRVEVAPDPGFSLEGQDVSTEVSVPLAVALRGGEVEVPTPRGSRVKLTVPPQTQNGTRLRLRGLGMPDAKGGGAGDLYAQVRVRLPLPADEATRRWIDAMPG